jgi:hypothetical protein
VAAGVKALQKPNSAAWAINQLYWRKRKTLERFMTAAGRLRQAHARRLAGQAADLALVEAAHRHALDDAVRDARALLEEAGDTASPATMTAVAETLDALAWTTPNGRLTRPLKPPGFEALAGMLAAAARKPPAEVVQLDSRPLRASAAQAARDEEAKRAAEATRRAAAALDRRIAAAEKDEARAGAALARARQRLAEAERERDRLAKALDDASARVGPLREEVQTAATHTQDTASARGRLQQQRLALGLGE